MPTGMEARLGPRDLRWRPSSPPLREKRAQTPIFGPCLLWPNGWKVEGLEKRLGLGLARSRSRLVVKKTSQSRGIAGRSWSRSRIGSKNECLGLVS